MFIWDYLYYQERDTNQIVAKISQTYNALLLCF